MRHVITAMDTGFVPATIVWDDVAGTVSGDHSRVPVLAETIGSAPVLARCAWGHVELVDPAHDPRDFLTALGQCVWWQSHIELPESLADVEPTPFPEPPGGPDFGDVIP